MSENKEVIFDYSSIESHLKNKEITMDKSELINQSEEPENKEKPEINDNMVSKDIETDEPTNSNEINKDTNIDDLETVLNEEPVSENKIDLITSDTKKENSSDEGIDTKPDTPKENLNIKESHITDELICMICHQLPRNYRQSKCCDSSFCKKCAQMWISTAISSTGKFPFCPHCREANFTSKKLTENVVAQKIINKRTIICDYCNNEITIGNKTKHYQICDKVNNKIKQRYKRKEDRIKRKTKKRKRTNDDKKDKKSKKRKQNNSDNESSVDTDLSEFSDDDSINNNDSSAEETNEPAAFEEVSDNLFLINEASMDGHISSCDEIEENIQGSDIDSSDVEENVIQQNVEKKEEEKIRYNYQKDRDEKSKLYKQMMEKFNNVNNNSSNSSSNTDVEQDINKKLSAAEICDLEFKANFKKWYGREYVPDDSSLTTDTTFDNINLFV